MGVKGVKVLNATRKEKSLSVYLVWCSKMMKVCVRWIKRSGFENEKSDGDMIEETDWECSHIPVFVLTGNEWMRLFGKRRERQVPTYICVLIYACGGTRVCNGHIQWNVSGRIHIYAEDMCVLVFLP